MCKRICDLFFEGVQPDPGDLPQILSALQKRVQPHEQQTHVTNGYNKVKTTETLRASAATTFGTHPAEMGRLWKLVGDKTEFNQADANICAIACEIFGKCRGHMAEEALKIIQKHLWDECTMEEANHALGLCTALARAPVIDAEVKGMDLSYTEEGKV